jgi:hypothetical protein
MHFKRRNYPLKLILEAAKAAGSKDRLPLLHPTKRTKNSNGEDIFLITTFHPSCSLVSDIAYRNWDILGKNEATREIYTKNLMVGYRRPKNLKDLLVRAGIHRIPGDEALDPQAPPAELAVVCLDNSTDRPSTSAQDKQTSILDFFPKRTEPQGPWGTVSLPKSVTDRTQVKKLPYKGTNPRQRGFSFCDRRFCRYCPKLNRTGKLTCHVTRYNHKSMEKISCRSSNLIYCITCMKCGMQYVGQTMLRLKDRLKHHFYDIEMNDMNKPVSRHFSQPDHNGTKIISVSVVEFIKKPPRSPVS